MKIRLMLIVCSLGCCLWWIVPAISDALTVEEILLLKQNGVSEATIQMMLQSEMQAQDRQAIDSAQKMGIRTIARPGGRSAIVYSTGSGDQNNSNVEARLKEERAWEMLRQIVVEIWEGDDKGLRTEN